MHRVRRRIRAIGKRRHGGERRDNGRVGWKRRCGKWSACKKAKKHDRKEFVARASSTDPDAHVMRNGEGGTVPSYNVQLLTDVTHGLVVNVDATTDAIDYRQLQPALERCERALGQKPKQIVADGDYTNHASVQAAAVGGVDFYGSWQESWKPGEHDARFPTMPNGTALLVLPERSSLITLC